MANNNSKKKSLIIISISVIATITTVTLAVIAYIKLKANKINKALFEASEYISFEDEDLDDMLNANNISDLYEEENDLANNQQKNDDISTITKDEDLEVNINQEEK